jgi:anti-sigma regulatory factor (Ser/Thr protein kinase)
MSALQSAKTMSADGDAIAIAAESPVRLTLRKYGPEDNAAPPAIIASASVLTGARLHPAMQLTIAMALLGATLVAISLLHSSTPSAHAPVALLVLPVIAAGLLFGRTMGLLTLFSALAGARVVFFPMHARLAFDSTGELLSFSSITVAMAGSSIVALYAHKAAHAVESTEARCQTFNRDVLLAVTSGRLVLCDSEEIARITAGELLLKTNVSVTADLQRLRHELKDAMSIRLGEDRIADLLTCVTEAATNALKYAGAASLQATMGKETISVIISDHGAGIDPSLLARATLESGFSTNNTLGMGYTLMLAMADKIALHTNAHGTQVVIQIRHNEYAV